MTKKGRGERVKLQEQWHQAVDYGDNKWQRLRSEGGERERERQRCCLDMRAWVRKTNEERKSERWGIGNGTPLRISSNLFRAYN